MTSGDLVRTHRSDARDEPPATWFAATDDVDLVGWAAAHRDLIDAELRTRGSLLFRGFGVTTREQFERTAEGLTPNLFTEYGDLPDASAGSKVYGSTPYPEDKAILFHNESSHLNSWPKTMCFCCVLPAQSGGETKRPQRR